jgi:prophage regulatory protein
VERLRIKNKSAAADTITTIRLKELAAALNVAPYTVQRWVKDGKFPPPIKLAQGVSAWRVSTVDAWLREREQAGGAS